MENIFKTCSFCNEIKDKRFLVFSGKEAYICNDCIERFSRKVVPINSYRKHKDVKDVMEALIPCPSCGEVFNPVLCIHCGYKWNLEDMALNLDRMIILSKAYLWAKQNFSDGKFFLSLEFDKPEKGIITLEVTLPLHHRSDNLSEKAEEWLKNNLPLKNTVVFDIDYDDLVFARL